MFDLSPKPMPAGRMIPAGDNHYHVIEKGAGREVIFLHGGGPGCTAWSDFAVVSDLFAEHYHCTMPDILQYGRSSKPIIAGPMWDFHSHSLAQLMDTLSITRADLVCNSWGGTIALRFASLYPERVRSLTITGSMPVFYGPLAPLPENGRRGRNARDRYYGGDGPSLEKMRELIGNLEWFDREKIPEETVRLRYEQSMDEEERALAAHSDNPRGDWQDLTNVLPTVTCPTLFCWGLQDDFLTPDYPMMLCRMVPSGQLHVLDRASHHLQEERPEHYFHIVHGFLQQPESREDDV
ncbi:MAG: alpha/beta fold hydrolase [Congregibacter sp.]